MLILLYSIYCADLSPLQLCEPDMRADALLPPSSPYHLQLFTQARGTLCCLRSFPEYVSPWERSG